MAEKNDKPLSRLIIDFAAPGSAECAWHKEGEVVPAQLLAAAVALDVYARFILEQNFVVQAAAQQKIAVPGLNPNLLKNNGFH